jgi:hypothetical protein
MRVLLSAILLLALFIPTGTAVAQMGCGPPPLPRLPPLGCKAMRPVCVCDSSGTECHWEFVCESY